MSHVTVLKEFSWIGTRRRKAQRSSHEELLKAKGIVLSGFQGITVSQDFELRPEDIRNGRAL